MSCMKKIVLIFVVCSKLALASETPTSSVNLNSKRASFVGQEARQKNVLRDCSFNFIRVAYPTVAGCFLGFKFAQYFACSNSTSCDEQLGCVITGALTGGTVVLATLLSWDRCCLKKR